MIYPNIEEIKKIQEKNEYGIIPIATEILSDIITPIEALKKLKRISKHCFILESVEDSKQWGRYSFLGFDPKLEITCKDNLLKITENIAKDENNNKTKVVEKTTDNPNKYIRKILKKYKSPNIKDLPPFTGGLVGYFSYDYIKYSEPSLKLDATDRESFKDVDLMLFDKLIVFDNFKQKIFLIYNIKIKDLSNKKIEIEYNEGIKELKKLKDILTNKNLKEEKEDSLTLKTEFEPLFSKEKFVKMVEKAKNYIKEGDIFQVVLSNPISAQIAGGLLDSYRILRTTNPSPYMFYFSSDDIEISGASPETLVKLNNNKLFSYPLAGTKPRGKTPEEDLILEKELLTDEKELAEHNMLVDLGRNDVGKVSKIGTVKVEKYLSIEKFSHVMHIGSTVTGEIREDKDAIDVINAILPAGTLSGAPKIRACEIINELEDNKRGIYGGAIGYLGFNGSMDTCIAIRIAFKKHDKVFIRSGAGIVADSIAEKEYEECINKAQAVINALKLSEYGI
ncbi:MAG: anthranilate synthase component I [Methanobrevibacter sp.]|jgi:anthranilate synthase component 1|nr:anthranilate synthase component I [Candidatus Methanoflexus mossambicus]